MKVSVVAVCLVTSAALAANEATLDGANSQITLLSPAVEFGELTPDTGPALATLTLLIRSDTAWRVSILRDSSPRRRAVQAFGRITAAAANDLLVRSEQGTWAPMLPGIAVPLASGMPTENSAGALRSIDFQLSVTMDMEAGTKEITLHVLLNERQSADLPLSYTVATVMKVAPDERGFRVVATDPSHTLRYDFEPHVYIVTSNVPWVLEAFVSDLPKAAGGTTSLSADALRVASLDGQYKPLIAGSPPVAVASGPPTGRAGVPVQVHLAVVTGGHESEGDYKAKVEFRVSKVDSALQVARRR
jgi:hypothetical protein